MSHYSYNQPSISRHKKHNTFWATNSQVLYLFIFSSEKWLEQTKLLMKPYKADLSMLLFVAILYNIYIYFVSHLLTNYLFIGIDVCTYIKNNLNWIAISWRKNVCSKLEWVVRFNHVVIVMASIINCSCKRDCLRQKYYKREMENFPYIWYLCLYRKCIENNFDT